MQHESWEKSINCQRLHWPNLKGVIFRLFRFNIKMHSAETWSSHSPFNNVVQRCHCQQYNLNPVVLIIVILKLLELCLFCADATNATFYCLLIRFVLLSSSFKVFNNFISRPVCEISPYRRTRSSCQHHYQKIKTLAIISFYGLYPTKYINFFPTHLCDNRSS